MPFFGFQEENEMAKVLSMRFGIAMKHAGVAITITSVTDLLAFAIGATTILPALKFFCLFAAMGIFFVFIYMATFFLAFFSLDQRRIEDDRNGCICCYKVTKDFLARWKLNPRIFMFFKWKSEGIGRWQKLKK